MLIVDIIFWQEIEPIKTKIICSLAWDDKLKRIMILKGAKVGKQILKDRYLDKRDYPRKLRYIEAKMGKAFIQNLCFGLCGTRVWATRAYKKEFE